MRELGYSEGAAWRRIKAMRLCAETAGTRERLQDGSLTLSAAAQLQNTFDLCQRTATAAAHPAAAPAAPELLPGATGTASEVEASGAEAAAPARPVPALDAAQRQELVAQASGKSTREVKQLLAGVAPELAPPADRMRALGEDRWELKAVIDSACQRGIEQLRALLSHVDPRLTLGQLVERLVQDGLQRYDPGRPRRGRGGGRREAGAGQAPEPHAPHAPEPKAPEPNAPAGPASGTASPAKRGAQEQPAVPPATAGASTGGSTPAPTARSAEQPARSFGSGTLDGGCGEAPAARSAEEPARGTGGAGTSAVAALPAPPSGRKTCGGSTPVPAKPAATAPGTATSAAKAAAGRGPHATVPTPRPTPPADQSMPTALAVADRGCNAASPAKRPGVAQLDGRSRPQPEVAGASGGARPSGGSAQPRRRARRSRYIPAPVRREVWRRDGGCCSYVDPHSGRRCDSRFLLELDHIVPFALGGSADPGNLRLHCSAHHRFRHRQTARRHTVPRERRLQGCESGGRMSLREQPE